MRYLHVDRITELAPDRARGVKCVSLADDAFADHFAGWPIYPGALVLEAMAQLAGAMLDDASGDQLALEADVEQRVEDGVRVRVSAAVGSERVAEAVLSYVTARDVPRAFVDERARVRALMQHGRWYR